PDVSDSYSRSTLQPEIRESEEYLARDHPEVPNRTALRFFNVPSTIEIYTLSLHDALPIWPCVDARPALRPAPTDARGGSATSRTDRKSTRLNSSHVANSFAFFREIKEIQATHAPV